MADEPTPAPAETEDTPVATPEAPESPDTPKSDSPETDYKQRYDDLRPEFDRRNELLADIEGRNGPEKQREALAEHARIELDDEEAEEDEPDDEFDLRDPIEEVDRIKQELAERDQAAQDAEFDQLEERYTTETIDSLQDAKGIELSQEERSLVEDYGFGHRDPHDGKPDFEGGLKSLEASWEAARKRYETSKTDAAMAPLGSSGEPKIDLRDKDARQKLGREVFEAAERAKET